jgi:hypothetical protein
MTAFCDECHDDGGSKHLWNVGLVQLDYTALYTRRLSSSYWPPWEPELSQQKVISNPIGTLEPSCI